MFIILGAVLLFLVHFSIEFFNIEIAGLDWEGLFNFWEISTNVSAACKWNNQEYCPHGISQIILIYIVALIYVIAGVCFFVARSFRDAPEKRLIYHQDSKTFSPKFLKIELKQTLMMGLASLLFFLLFPFEVEFGDDSFRLGEAWMSTFTRYWYFLNAIVLISTFDIAESIVDLFVYIRRKEVER